MPFIILDRDGVINHDSEAYIKSPAEWHPIPASLEAIACLNQHGFKVLIATNQSGIGRGYFDFAMLNQIHAKLVDTLALYGGSIEEIFICPHHPDVHCECRKPKPGLIYQMQQKYRLNVTETFFIGDACSDIKAAKAAGCLPILVLTGKGQHTLRDYPDFAIIPHFPNLKIAVDYVLSNLSQ